ncbi:MAG: phosphatase PAP2 family protein [Elusimicrobia bacterium]|nr:phosphatase PAP2 family protein [Elusimicrobiota bacterium]
MISFVRLALPTILLFSSYPLSAETPSEVPSLDLPVHVRRGYGYTRPHPLAFITHQPSDMKMAWQRTFKKENILPLSLLAAGTGVLIVLDQYLFERTYKAGDTLNITHESEQNTLADITLPGSYKVRLNGPNNIGTGLYFLGDGITHAAIAGSFLTVGLMASDNRALQTASQLVEGILANGIVVQLLKHTTGRENPNTATQTGGKWQFFPNQKDYAKHVNKYDAFPSGHLSTAMVTVTVISSNYPEYKFVRPLGYTLMGALSFQMVNNGVHWYSDYPLAIAMGWMFGKIAVDRGRSKTDDSASLPFFIGPTTIAGKPGLALTFPFGGPPSKKARSPL